MNPKEYWEECINIALSDFDIDIPADVVSAIAESVEGGFDNYGMAFYQPSHAYVDSGEIMALKEKVSDLERKLSLREEAIQANLKSRYGPGRDVYLRNDGSVGSY